MYHIQTLLLPAALVAIMMTIFVAVSMTDDNGDWHLHWVGHGLLDVHGDMFLDVDGVRPVNRDLYGVGHLLLYRVRNVFLNRVRGGYWHFDGVRHGFLYMYGVRSINVDLYGVGNGLLNWVRYGFLDRVRYGLGNVYGVRPVDGHLHRDVHFFVYWVGSRYMYWHLHWIRNLFLDGVGSRNMNLDGYVHLFFNGVRLGHIDLYGNGPVNGHMNWVWYLLFNRVGSWYMHGYFDDLFDWVRYVFHNGVGLRNVHLDRYRNMFLHWVGDMLLYGVRDRNLLHYSNGFVNVRVGVVTTAVATAVTTTKIITETTFVSAVSSIAQIK